MTKLEAIIKVAEVIQTVSALDCDVLVCDSNEIVVCSVPPKTFITNNEVGRDMKGPESPFSVCLKTKKVINAIIPERVYGCKLKAILYPIIEEDGQVSGVLATATTMKMQDDLHKASKAIEASAQHLASTAQEVAESAVQLAGELNNGKIGGERVLNEINNTKDILKFVSGVAADSNLLGLNAAIEAARAGELGRGFAVVAGEIRKMAVNSADSVQRIDAILQKIQEETDNVVNTIMTTAVLGERQAAAMQEMTATIQQLSVSAGEIKRTSDIV